VLEKGTETTPAAGSTAPVSSAGAPATLPPRGEKPVTEPATGKKPARVMPVIGNLQPVAVPVMSEAQTTTAEPAPDNHNAVTAPVTSSEKSNVISLHHGRPSPAGSCPEAAVTDESAPSMPSQPDVAETPAEQVALPAALQRLRNMTTAAEQPATSVLSILQKARQRPAASENNTGTGDNNGGESMNLEMKVTALPDGGLSVTTAGKPVTPANPEEAHRTNRQLAQEEENILLHRDAGDPGYDENDQYYYDREPEL